MRKIDLNREKVYGGAAAPPGDEHGSRSEKDFAYRKFTMISEDT
jgi:hypothetical protein